MKKEYRKIAIALLFLISAIILNYLIELNSLKYWGEKDAIRSISSYTFWAFSLSNMIGAAIQMLSPCILLFVIVYPLFKIIKTGSIENIITKMSYKKYILSNILKAYVKSLFLFPLFSVIVFVGGSLIFNNTLTSGSLHILSFPTDNNPYIAVIMEIVTIALYSIIIINVGMILTRYFKKFYQIIVITFMLVFVVMITESQIIGPILNVLLRTEVFSRINFWDMYFPRNNPNWVNIICFGLLRFVISSVCVWICYKDKEKLVLQNG